jgi:hypothetical protein
MNPTIEEFSRRTSGRFLASRSTAWVTHPGVGPLTALVYVLIIGTPAQFECGKQIPSHRMANLLPEAPDVTVDSSQAAFFVAPRLVVSTRLVMSKSHLTRRNFLKVTAVGGAGFCAGWSKGCKPIPASSSDSPYYNDKYMVSRALLGATPGTSAMATPPVVQRFAQAISCLNAPTQVFTKPSSIKAMVYYPGGVGSEDVSQPIPTGYTPKSWPLVLLAHARRPFLCLAAYPPQVDSSLFDAVKDYQRVGFLLDENLVSYGCAVVVPDFSLLAQSDFDGVDRGHVQRVVLVGHSTGGTACLRARGEIVSSGGPESLAVALIAPAISAIALPLAAEQTPHALMVLKGTNDTKQGANPDAVYGSAKPPKVLVTLSGVNHFGYTDICDMDNQVCAADDVPGSITRFSQQLAAGAYLAALIRRFALGDSAVNPYLAGESLITGLGMPLKSQIQVTQAGM